MICLIHSNNWYSLKSTSYLIFLLPHLVHETPPLNESSHEIITAKCCYVKGDAEYCGTLWSSTGAESTSVPGNLCGWFDLDYAPTLLSSVINVHLFLRLPFYKLSSHINITSQNRGFQRKTENAVYPKINFNWTILFLLSKGTTTFF